MYSLVNQAYAGHVITRLVHVHDRRGEVLRWHAAETLRRRCGVNKAGAV